MCVVWVKQAQNQEWAVSWATWLKTELLGCGWRLCWGIAHGCVDAQHGGMLGRRLEPRTAAARNRLGAQHGRAQGRSAERLTQGGVGGWGTWDRACSQGEWLKGVLAMEGARQGGRGGASVVEGGEGAGGGRKNPKQAREARGGSGVKQWGEMMMVGGGGGCEAVGVVEGRRQWRSGVAGRRQLWLRSEVGHVVYCGLLSGGVGALHPRGDPKEVRWLGGGGGGDGWWRAAWVTEAGMLGGGQSGRCGAVGTRGGGEKKPKRSVDIPKALTCGAKHCYRL